MHLSPPHVLRGLLLTLCCALLLVHAAPLQGQTTLPNPSTAIESIADTAQNLGALGFAVVSLGIALVVLIIGILVFFWKAISPLLTAIAASTKSRDEAAEAEREARSEEREARKEQQEESSEHLKIFDERERETQALRTRQAEAMESLGQSMERMANKMNENDKLSEEGRTEAVKAINAHTDEKLDELRRKDIEPMDKKLDVILKHVAPGAEPDPTALHVGDTVQLQAAPPDPEPKDAP